MVHNMLEHRSLLLLEVSGRLEPLGLHINYSKT